MDLAKDYFIDMCNKAFVTTMDEMEEQGVTLETMLTAGIVITIFTVNLKNELFDETGVEL